MHNDGMNSWNARDDVMLEHINGDVLVQHIYHQQSDENSSRKQKLDHLRRAKDRFGKKVASDHISKSQNNDQEESDRQKNLRIVSIKAIK